MQYISYLLNISNIYNISLFYILNKKSLTPAISANPQICNVSAIAKSAGNCS